MISLFKHNKKTNSNVTPKKTAYYVYIIKVMCNELFNRDSSNDNSIHEYRLTRKGTG